MSQDDNGDRRHEARLSPGDVECEIEGARFVHVLGVTVGGHGMRVLTDKQLPRNQPLQMSLSLSSETLSFVGEVVWEQEQDFEFTHRYISGVKFIDPDPQATEKLHQFVEKCIEQQGINPNGDPVPGG